MEITFSYAQLASPSHPLQDSLVSSGGRLEEVELWRPSTHGVTGGVYRHDPVGPRGAVYGVMDGVGSAELSKQAAECTAETLREFVGPRSGLPLDIHGLRQAFLDANATVHSWGVSATGLSRGAAAASAVWIPPAPVDSDRVMAVVGHVGDTFGWTWDGELLRPITPGGVGGGILLMHVGKGETFEVRVEKVRIDDAMTVLLVTDGVTKGLSQTQVLAILGQADVEDAAREIVIASKGNGSRDDITALAFQITDW